MQNTQGTIGDIAMQNTCVCVCVCVLVYNPNVTTDCFWGCKTQAIEVGGGPFPFLQMAKASDFGWFGGWLFAK